MKSSETIELTGHSLTIEDVVLVARRNYRVEIDKKAIARVRRSRDLIDQKVQAGEVIYGVTTGFGANADKVLNDSEESKLLQKNLIRSHACGVGDNFSVEAVRAAMCIRLNTLLAGHSGIQVTTVELLRDFLNKKIHPLVPSQGSVGSSGDLCPLSHMALPLLGEGKVEYMSKEMNANEALSMAGLHPIHLAHKEGLALNNGTSFMTAVAVLSVYDAERLVHVATLTASLSAEALCARKAAFDERIHIVRKQKGQILIAEHIRNYIDGSTFIDVDPKKIEGKKNLPQDAYSIRCIPQVHGASLTAVLHARDIVTEELNAVVDNPIIFPDTEEALSGGNFHGQPIALVMDYLKLALAELGNISERRIAKLVDSSTNEGLAGFLIENSGLNSGLMIPQYVAASLVSENKVLVHPASADSIPTCANTEDHVSMGTIGARQSREILENVKKVIAIEMLTAAQAVDLRKKSYQGNLGALTGKLYTEIRKVVSYIDNDRILHNDIVAILSQYDSAVKLVV